MSWEEFFNGKDGSWTGKREEPWVDCRLPCGCPDNTPQGYGQCVLTQPLYMYIPPEGVHLSCPVHPAGHHIYGQHVRC